MSSKPVNKNFFVICACAAMMSALALTGCSIKTNERDETAANTSSAESTGDYSSENSEALSGDTSSKSTGEVQTSSNDAYPGQEIYLDREYLETVERDMLETSIYLRMDEVALLDEYARIYPDLVTEISMDSFVANDPYHWSSFVCSRGEQMVKDFLIDYGIDYNEKRVLTLMARIAGEFDKNTISSMLDDPRVAEIIYYPEGRITMTDWS